MYSLSDMKRRVTTTNAIRAQIERLPRGEPFTPAVLLAHGTRAAVDQALSRMVRAGALARVARGVYVVPTVSRYVGRVSPSPWKVAEATAHARGELIQIAGAEAALGLELSTQVPMTPAYLTSGRSRRVRMGGLEVRLRHTSPRKLALAGRPAGIALAAMWYLGKRELTPSTVERIRRKLSKREFAALRAARSVMPGWMNDVFLRHARAGVRDLA